jgi:hypothetical protein
MRAIHLFAATAALCLSGSALADIQYYEISGEITESRTSVDLPVSVGTPFIGTIAYNPDPFTCAPLGTGPLTLCDSAGAAAVAWDVLFGPFALFAENRDAWVNDSGILFADGPHQMLPLVFDGYVPTAQIDTYLILSGTPQSFVQLPSTLLGQQISFLEDAYLIKADGSGLTEWDFGGQVTSIKEIHPRVAVIEPGMGGLLCLGLGALVWAMRRR